MLDLFLTGLVFAAGYAASIYTWPWLRTELTGGWAEVNALRARAIAIETKLRGL